jgi:glucose-6-phosphate isomerase
MKINLSRQPQSIEKLYEVAATLKNEIKELNHTLENPNYTKYESFVKLPFDENQIVKLLEFKKSIDTKNLKKIIVIGIGGSIQGAKAVYEVLKKHKSLISTEFIDQIDSEKIQNSTQELKNLNSNEYLIFVITKSGTTTETLYNFELLKNNSNLDLKRVVFITEENSHLISICESKKIPYLTFPKKISGRFSIFTFVGLAPLAISGVNIIKLLEGAMEQINYINDFDQNNALFVAGAKSLNKKIINENLYPSRHFGELGKWEKQLFNESLGKSENAIFTSFGNFYLELHSSLQHYLNSKHIFLNTLYVKDSNPLILKETEYLSKNFNQTDTEEIQRAILTSVMRELDQNKIPVVSIELEDYHEKEIGSYLQFKMLEVYFLAKIMDVNPFDQPEVNSYKANLTRYL